MRYCLLAVSFGWGRKREREVYCNLNTRHCDLADILCIGLPKSIRENILFGRKDTSEAQMIEAAKKTDCHDFIMKLPEGYGTVTGEAGSTLSGGEKQRIAIARALLKNAQYALRATWIGTLSALFGYSNIKTTMAYTHVLNRGG